MSCPLCSAGAISTWKPPERRWIVDCGICGRFAIDEYLMNVIRSGREAQDDRVCRLLPLLSQAAQDSWAAGIRLDLIGENWQAVAHDAQRRQR